MRAGDAPAGAITAERVMRNIEHGFSFWAMWAPNVVAALVAEKRVEVRSGWVKPFGIDENGWRRLKKRGITPWSKARKKQEQARAMMPCTTSALARQLKLTKAGALYIVERLGAVKVGEVGEVDGIGRMRPRPMWGIP